MSINRIADKSIRCFVSHLTSSVFIAHAQNRLRPNYFFVFTLHIGFFYLFSFISLHFYVDAV